LTWILYVTVRLGVVIGVLMLRRPRTRLFGVGVLLGVLSAVIVDAVAVLAILSYLGT
jgi:hypothetical protein